MIGDIISVYGGEDKRVIVFTERKEEANEIMLKGKIKIKSAVLHGDIP